VIVVDINDITSIMAWENTTGKKYPKCSKCEVLYADNIEEKLCEFCIR